MGRAIGVVIATTVLLGPMPAAADAAYDACVRKLCVSTRQSDCWVKAGAAICDRDQVQCQDLPDHAGAVILRKARGRWEVKTDFGRGWVSDRMMMVSGDKC